MYQWLHHPTYSVLIIWIGSFEDKTLNGEKLHGTLNSINWPEVHGVGRFSSSSTASSKQQLAWRIPQQTAYRQQNLGKTALKCVRMKQKHRTKQISLHQQEVSFLGSRSEWDLLKVLQTLSVNPQTDIFPHGHTAEFAISCFVGACAECVRRTKTTKRGGQGWKPCPTRNWQWTRLWGDELMVTHRDIWPLLNLPIWKAFMWGL